jgi:hypothetical protein
MQTIFDEDDDENGPDSSWIIVDKKERRQKNFRERIEKLSAMESIQEQQSKHLEIEKLK